MAYAAEFGGQQQDPLAEAAPADIGFRVGQS
jgi:hypothetical protein